MAIYSCSIKSISRGSKGGGRSIIASAAYVNGERLTSFSTGEVYDYTRKQGVESSDIYLPSGTLEWATDREKLWNTAEQAEKRKNSCLGRQLIVAIPYELSKAQRAELVGTAARIIAQRYNVAVDAAIHAPSREGDERNFHAHILFSSRRINAEGFWEKTRELDDKRTSSKEVRYLREMWATEANKALQRANVQERIDPRSLRAQGIKRMPSVHLGPTATAMERRGVRSRMGDLNRDAQALNAQAASIEREIKQLDQIRADLKQKELNEQKRQKEIEQTRKNVEKLRPHFESWAVVAHGLFAGDAGAMFDQTKYPTRQCNGVLKSMRALNLVDENKQVQPETIASVFQSGSFWVENAKLFCLMKNEQGQKDVSFSDIYEMPQRVAAFAESFRAEQERAKKAREEQEAIEQERRDKQRIQAWKQLANPQYTEDEKNSLAYYERLSHYERQNIASELSEATKNLSLCTEERECAELTAKQCEKSVLHLQNKLDHIGIIESLFSRSGIERTLADAERKRVDALKQVKEKSKEVEETTKKIRFYLVAQKAPGIIRQRTAEAQERQAKALTPEIEVSLARQRQRDEAEKARMEQEREKAWQLKRQQERDHGMEC